MPAQALWGMKNAEKSGFFKTTPEGVAKKMHDFYDYQELLRNNLTSRMI